MKTRMLIMLLLITTFNLMAQDNFTGHMEKRASKPFHHINISGELKVKLIHSDEPYVTVYGSNFQIDNTITMLRSDTLFIYQTNIRKKDTKAKLAIYADDITLLEVKGKTTVDGSEFNADVLSVKIKDGAEVKLKTTSHEKTVETQLTPFIKAAQYAKWTPVMNTCCSIE